MGEDDSNQPESESESDQPKSGVVDTERWTGPGRGSGGGGGDSSDNSGDGSNNGSKNEGDGSNSNNGSKNEGGGDTGDGGSDQYLEPPVSNIYVKTSNPKAGDTVTLDGSRSHDRDGEVVNYKWVIKRNGTTIKKGAGKQFSTTLSTASTYKIELTVTDNQGLQDTESRDLVIKEGGQKGGDSDNKSGDSSELTNFVEVGLFDLSKYIVENIKNRSSQSNGPMFLEACADLDEISPGTKVCGLPYTVCTDTDIGQICWQTSFPRPETVTCANKETPQMVSVVAYSVDLAKTVPEFSKHFEPSAEVGRWIGEDINGCFWAGALPEGSPCVKLSCNMPQFNRPTPTGNRDLLVDTIFRLATEVEKEVDDGINQVARKYGVEKSTKRIVDEAATGAVLAGGGAAIARAMPFKSMSDDDIVTVSSVASGSVGTTGTGSHGNLIVNPEFDPLAKWLSSFSSENPPIKPD